MRKVFKYEKFILKRLSRDNLVSLIVSSLSGNITRLFHQYLLLKVFVPRFSSQSIGGPPNRYDAYD